eukprot:1158033-Pelagomonas_calceolata.AAC.4
MHRAGPAAPNTRDCKQIDVLAALRPCTALWLCVLIMAARLKGSNQPNLQHTGTVQICHGSQPLSIALKRLLLEQGGRCSCPNQRHQLVDMYGMLSRRLVVHRRPSLDWPNINNQKGFKPKDQPQGPPNLVLPDAANNMVGTA